MKAKASQTVQNDNPVELLMTRKDVCNVLQVSLPTVIRLEAAGKLPSLRLGAGSVRYRKIDVERYINSCVTVR